MVLLRSIPPTPGSRVFFLVFDVPSPKCFAQTWDRHSCQASKTGAALEKKKGNFQEIRVVIVRVRKKKKCPVTERSFKMSPKTSWKPKAPELEHLAPNLSKARETKKLFKTDITPEEKEIISSFERKSSLDSLAQNIPEWPSPFHAHNLSFTHDGYIRHTATEMIILMTDISVMWHSNGLKIPSGIKEKKFEKPSKTP